MGFHKISAHLSIFFLAAGMATTGCGDDAGGEGPADAMMMDASLPDAPAMMDGSSMGDASMMQPLIEDPISALVAARVAVNEQLCACSYEELGFSDQAECVDYVVYLEENNPEGPTLGCEDTAAEINEEVQRDFSCRVSANQAYATCLESAACDMAATDACDVAADAALTACPEAGEDAFDAYLDSLITCVSGATADTCPDEVGTPDGSGEAVFVTDTFGRGNEFTGSCSGEYAPDVTFEWTAPATGRFVFETFASRYDTSLYVLEGGCGGTMELGCSDDILDEEDPLWVYAPGYQAGLILDVTMGTTYLVVLDGYDGAAGQGTVAIYPESVLGADGSS